MVGGTQLAKLGDGGYDRGARARQIRDDLRQLQSATQEDMLDIQLDDRAVFLERWYNQLLSALSNPGALSNRERLEFRGRLRDWSGRADVGSIAYRLVREYRGEVARRVFEPISVAAKKGLSRFFLRFSQVRGPTLENGRLAAGESTQSQVRELECFVFVCRGCCD